MDKDLARAAYLAMTKRAPPAIPEDVRETLLALVDEEKAFAVTSHYPSDDLDTARAWLASAPVATDKAVCPGCRECLYSPPRTEKGGAK